MNGKTLKVVELNYNFTPSDRYVNVFGFFKYKKNGNLYVIYTDINTIYEIIYYGSSHKKDGNLLSMACKNEESEIIKEYIYKLTNNEELENFEIYTLDDINQIELISSNKLEIKLEVIKKLEALTIPKNKEELTQEQQKKIKTKSKNKNLIPILLLILAIMGGGYFYLTNIINTDKLLKTIFCTKNYQHKKLNATVEEKNTYSFIKNDKLKNIENISIYKFTTQQDYETFINNGDIYNYMPKNLKKYTPNETEFIIEYISSFEVDESYKEPTEYETINNYYTNNGYSCSEKIEK